MNLKTTQLRQAITLALGLGTLATATGAFAQEPAKNDATNLDRIQVTGTRIRQVDTETAQPVLTITRADIEKQGFQSVADIIQNISAVGTPPISRASPLSAGETAGGVFISLRNLGAQRTLVLLNGKRLGISTSGFADISLIPAVAVERIEVLKDGASSIYGSDAIAGVINVITRENYKGAAGSVYYGEYSEGDGAIAKSDFIAGFNGERGSVTAAVETGREEVVHASDRDFSRYPRSSYHPTDGWTTVGQYGGFVTTATTAVPGVPTGTRVILRPGGNPRNRADYVAQNTLVGTCTGATTTTGCIPGSTADKSNTLQQTDLRTPLERLSFYVSGVFDISDRVRLHGDLMWSNRDSDRTVAGYPMQAASFATPMSAQSYFNPTGATISNWWRRTWEQPRLSESELTTFRYSATLEGDFEIAGRPFNWDASYLRNSNRVVQRTYGNLTLANVRAAVGPSFLDSNGQVVCGTPDNPATPTVNERNVIAGCVPWNPFLAYGVEGPGGLTNNAALQDFLFDMETTTGRTQTDVFSANFNGTLFPLPAGDVQFAVGYENREEKGRFNPDPLAVSGGSTNLSSGPTRGGYRVNEVYAEVQVPVLKDMFLARELTLDVASRYSDYNTFGDTTNNKFGLKWRPIESLLLRATHADGFRAPTISDLYGGGSQTFSNFTDPCDTGVAFGQSLPGTATRANCVAAMGALGNTYRQLGQGFVAVNQPNAQTPVAFISGSNPLLTPEVSKSQTVGAVWSPGFLPGFNLALDWWKIRIGDTIVADSPNSILNDCYVLGISSRCSPLLFTRDPALGYVNFMSFGNQNAGFRKVEGFDFDVSYRLATDSIGTFTLVANSTYTAKDYFVSTKVPQYVISSVGIANANTSFRVRSNVGLSWQMGNFGASWTTRYYSGLKETCTYAVPGLNEPNLECQEIHPAPTGAFIPGTTNPASTTVRRHVVGANAFHDLQVRWNAPWDATISVGANNLFGHVGPVLYAQPSANVSYYGGFDIGRFLYVKYAQKF